MREGVDQLNVRMRALRVVVLARLGEHDTVRHVQRQVGRAVARRAQQTAAHRHDVLVAVVHLRDLGTYLLRAVRAVVLDVRLLERLQDRRRNRQVDELRVVQLEAERIHLEHLRHDNLAREHGRIDGHTNGTATGKRRRPRLVALDPVAEDELHKALGQRPDDKLGVAAASTLAEQVTALPWRSRHGNALRGSIDPGVRLGRLEGAASGDQIVDEGGHLVLLGLLPQHALQTLHLVVRNVELHDLDAVKALAQTLHDVGPALAACTRRRCDHVVDHGVAHGRAVDLHRFADNIEDARVKVPTSHLNRQELGVQGREKRGDQRMRDGRARLSVQCLCLLIGMSVMVHASRR